MYGAGGTAQTWTAAWSAAQDLSRSAVIRELVDREQTAATIKDGGSYDIPFGCLVPKGLRNVLVSGRCLSATRDAHSSARVMGTCMAMGQAAGTAAGMCGLDEGWQGDVRSVRVPTLRASLREQGSVLDGTY